MVSDRTQRPNEAAATFEDEADTNRFVKGGTSAVAERMPVDRRAARRVPLEVTVFLATGDGDPIEGKSEDVSTSGLFVRTGRLIPAGRRLRLRFELPQGAMDVYAVVVRFRMPTPRAPAGLGLCFQELSEPQATALDAFCRSADSVAPAE